MCFVAPVAWYRGGRLSDAVCRSKLWAAPPSEQLLPGTTKGYVSVGNVERFRTDWAKTQLGQLLADPIMQPFVKDFQAPIPQMESNAPEAGRHLGRPGRGVPSGEVALAIVQPSTTEAALVLIADVTGRQGNDRPAG